MSKPKAVFVVMTGQWTDTYRGTTVSSTIGVTISNPSSPEDVLIAAQRHFRETKDIPPARTLVLLTYHVEEEY